MQFIYWVIFLLVIALAIFAIENSDAPRVTIKFLYFAPIRLLKFDTSLVLAILGSFGFGILVSFLFWIPRAIRSTFSMRKLDKEIKDLEVKHQQKMKENL
jgi:uncharacterized integral membrane protein